MTTHNTEQAILRLIDKIRSTLDAGERAILEEILKEEYKIVLNK